MSPRQRRPTPPKSDPSTETLPAKARAGCCEEASTLSGKFYIPCNRPAVAIVGWKGRSDTPIRMCDQCEFHNISNRGGYRVKAYDGPALMEQTLPSLGHNSDTNDDALIAENFKLEDMIKAANAKLADWAVPYKARVAEIEAEISRRLLERKANNTKTDSGTAYFSDILNTKVEKTEALFDYVADHWEEIGGDVKIAVPVDVVRTYMETNDGKPPPGMSISFYKRLNIKRS